MELALVRPHPSRRIVRPSRGFTLVEILIVIVMISVLGLVAIPRFANANARRQMESARLRVMAAVATARQAAIQKGEPVNFMLDNDSVTVKVGTQNLMSPVKLMTVYKVKGQPNVTLTFNARGFLSPMTRQVIALTRSDVPADSVVISKTGMVQR